MIRMLSVAFVVGLSATALAQTLPEGSATLTPNGAGEHSTLSMDFDPQEGSTSETPQSLALYIAHGFKYDRRSRAVRCSDAQAQQLACPAKSRIATGTATVNASGVLVPGGSQDFVASIEAFLAAPPSPAAIAGVVVQVREPATGISGSGKGRLTKVADGPFGSALIFDEFPGTAQVPPGVTLDVKRIQMTVGAKRRVRKVKKIRRKGKVVKRKVKIRRYYLITNPTTCEGSWPFQVRVKFPSSEVVRDGTVACAA